MAYGILACLLLLSSAGRAAEGASEYAVKAAFLYNFAKFVEWPAGTFAGAADPIALCVLGENPFGTLLEDAVRDKTVNGREITVHGSKTLSAAAGCHIVFLASGSLEGSLAALANSPVLTVSDAESAVERGAIIGLKLQERKVRFEVNLISARKARLKLSSQLLKIAVRLVGQL
jgi:hypothetical protein